MVHQYATHVYYGHCVGERQKFRRPLPALKEKHEEIRLSNVKLASSDSSRCMMHSGINSTRSTRSFICSFHWEARFFFVGGRTFLNFNANAND